VLIRRSQSAWIGIFFVDTFSEAICAFDRGKFCLKKFWVFELAGCWFARRTSFFLIIDFDTIKKMAFMKDIGFIFKKWAQGSTLKLVLGGSAC
jgi:hypothetical protein